jgi:type III restriction enzyme
LDKFPVKDVHNGYFSQDSKGRIKDTSGETKADDDTYSLIMKDKEKLLGLSNSLRFIFSHSALREGWDNPNVFQICTLNETKSEIKKRQEIGRGLRLAVDQEGKRIYDRNINRLTVIANESYEDFAKSLQQEIEEDCGVSFEGRVKNKQARTAIKYRKGFEVDPAFLEIWEKLKKRTTYKVDYKTDDLIAKAVKGLKELPKIHAPSIRSTKVRITMGTTGVDTEYAGDKLESYGGYTWKIPDVLGYIQSKTELTRSTIEQILVQSGRVEDILVNPQLFLDLAIQIIKRILNDLMIDGIKYQKIGGKEYEMSLFESQELEIYLNAFSYKVKDTSKTIYEEYIPLDSNVESQFAKDCESSEQVKFYFKLPNWFKIPTPIGNYNPDWAVVFENENKVYFVAETKDTGTPIVDIHKLSPDEQMKIKCGKAHFEEFEDLEYRVVSKVGQLVD